MNRLNFNYLPLSTYLSNLAIAEIKASDLSGGVGGAGATGPQGPAGATGIQGLTGATGSQGLSGPTGSTGPTGPEGLSVQSATVDSGNLIITLTDSNTIVAGQVVGATGLTGTIDQGNLISLQMVFS
jgi:hypothetical protein